MTPFFSEPNYQPTPIKMNAIKENTRSIRGFLNQIEDELKKTEPNLQWIESRRAHAKSAVNEIDAQLDVVADVFRCLGHAENVKGHASPEHAPKIDHTASSASHVPTCCASSD